MGVWARGPRPDRVDLPGIAAAMRPALEAWMSGRIEIIDFHRGEDRAPEVVLDSGANGALIQPLRAPSSIDMGGQPTNLLGVRFQLKRAPEVAEGQVLRGGLAVRVLDGGNAPDLTRWAFSLTEALDSSLAWDRIYEAVVVTGGS